MEYREIVDMYYFVKVFPTRDYLENAIFIVDRECIKNEEKNGRLNPIKKEAEKIIGAYEED